MGTIGSALSGYYQLSSLLSSGSGSSTAASASSSLQSLENALFASSSSGASGSSDSYLLDLSPQAQSLLNGASSGSGASTQFVLSKTQETAIENILAKYKNAPLDQATFNSIQNDLQAAGLSPQTLGAEDQINSFNSTGLLLDALNGNYSTIPSPGASASNEQTKESSYMQQIASLWKSEDTSSSASGISSASGASL